MCKEIADLLYPEITWGLERYTAEYPPRQLVEGAMVCRFAPSPTGFIHIGNIYAALFSERFSHQSQGRFLLRIEDTDKNREVEGGVDRIIKALQDFGLTYDEGPLIGGGYQGEYAPYKQSDRLEIYCTFIKVMLEKGVAYPCFCTIEELNEVRAEQEKQKTKQGYYGSWARHRNLDLESVKSELAQGKTPVIRLKSPGDFAKKITYKDYFRGTLTMPENDQDVVLMKSDGYPTYHLAHLADDYLMRITHVIRSDEWLASMPLHLQLFQVMELAAPVYGHVSPIMKMDGTSRRKLSKRKDPEAAISFYFEQGYPAISILEYLLTLINSNFEDWRRDNQEKPYQDFKIRAEKTNAAGALFDFMKLDDVSRGVIGRLSAKEVLTEVLAWTAIYDKELHDMLAADTEYTRAILNIEREQKSRRKDVAKWSDLRDYSGFFFDELFAQTVASFPESIAKEDIQSILSGYLGIMDLKKEKSEWFEDIKRLAASIGFAESPKEYKENLGKFRGQVGDIAMVLRVALTHKTTTPDLYEIMRVMGEERVRNRIKKNGS